MPDLPPPHDAAPVVHAEACGDHLRVTLTGARSTMQASIAMWREVGHQVALHRATRVLVVSQLRGLLPTPQEQEAIINALVGTGWDGVRTAFVLQDAIHAGSLEHGEIQARGHGQASRVFGSEAQAEVWLRHGV